RSIWAALLLAICYGGCCAFPSPVDCATVDFQNQMFSLVDLAPVGIGSQLAAAAAA
ncbi:hypothetical protein HAX54_052689, partial [Datura stramonium]|nr:hypothetical protein [Datura stramonium]